MAANAVTLDNVVKTYNKGKTTAVQGVSFTVNPGELFGLIGPDGAGKTTIFRILTTLLLADSGTATVDGFDVVKQYHEIRGAVGYMPQRFSLYQDLSVEENLNFFAAIFNTTVKGNYNLIKDIYVQLEPFKARRAGKLSGGMKQKLALCCALIHKPEVLFLDEPTTGVDAVSRKEFWEMLKRLKSEGITILVSTPYMDEAAMCDRIGLIQSGKILAIDTPENIRKSYPRKLYAVKSNSMYAMMNDIRSGGHVHDCFIFGENLHLSFADERPENQENLKQFLAKKGYTGVELNLVEPSVEDSFIDRTLSK